MELKGFACILCSRGYYTQSKSASEDSNGDTNDAIEVVRPKQKKGRTSTMKKPIEVDSDGQPFGSMKEAFSNNVKKYAKDLDPRVGWDKQIQRLRQNFFKREDPGMQKVGALSCKDGLGLHCVVLQHCACLD